MKEYTFKAQYTDEVERFQVLERLNKVMLIMLEDRPSDKFTIECWKSDNLFFVSATYKFV